MLPTPRSWAEETDLSFEVAPGLTAQARVTGDGGVEISTSRRPEAQRLRAASDEEGRSSLDHGDYNFDGYQDLASRASMGQVNEAVFVHVYDPGKGVFRELLAPTVPAASCEGFWSLAPDAASRTLVSTCRSGPMWYSDVYRYNGNRLYLYRTMRLAHLQPGQLEPVLTLDVVEEAGPLAVWSTFDPSGRVLEHAIGNGLELPPHGAPLQGDHAVVVPPRLPLLASRGDTSSRRYLVKGDQVELLDVDDAGWLQVRFRNPTRGPVRGWVKLPQTQ
ncbi:MAG: SH3 domain-containing protein [Pseudoxanthomonas sp.]